MMVKNKSNKQESKTKHKCKECVHKEEIDYYVKPYEFQKITKPLKYWKHMRKYPFRFFMIMITENGMFELKYVYHEKNMFVFNNGVYMIHPKFYKWSDELQTNVGFYIEGISLPLNLEIDKNMLKTLVEKRLDGTNVQANVDANILGRTVQTEVIEKVMQGEKLEEIFRRLKLIGLISAGVSILILLVLFWQFS